MRADVALQGARLGLDGPVVDLAVVGGRIVAITPHGSGRRDAVETLDVAGSTVLRGLWDRHVHSRQWALRRNSIDVSGARTAVETARLVVDGARRTDGPVLAYGAVETNWPDALDKDLLAGVDRPVLVLTQDLHTAWLNQSALDRIGNGDHPTGRLRERACFSAAETLTAAAAGDVERWIADAMQDAARLGIVGILDLELSDNISDWQQRAARAPLPVRVVCGVPRRRLDQAVADGLHSGDILADPQITVGPVKVFVDGSLGSRTALCATAYPGPDGDLGQQEIASDELADLVTHACAHGLAVAVHAIGDRANTIALDAFAAAGVGGRIEHAQQLSDDDIPRFAGLGVVAGVQPAHLHDDRDLADELWRGRTHGAYAYRALHDAGARLEFGSDAPVSPLDPWLAISAAVTRAGGDRPPWHAEQRLDLAVALDCATLGRAAPHPGDDADLVVVAGDASELVGGAPDVQATMLAGRWTHRRGG